jgi:hypothetical protein
MMKKGNPMKGSIRFVVGFLLVFGAVGGMDNGTDAQLPALLAVAALGLFSMYSATKAMKR